MTRWRRLRQALSAMRRQRVPDGYVVRGHRLVRAEKIEQAAQIRMDAFDRLPKSARDVLNYGYSLEAPVDDGWPA